MSERFDFFATNNFDFVRLPMNYRLWTTGTNYDRPDEAVLALVDGHLSACRQRGIHLSLNLHRAPGYCITRAESEIHNLWTDEVAQDAFVGLWEGFARRHLGVPADDLSFDLLNEPPAIGLRGFTREVHERLMRRTIDAIRAVDPERPIVLDGIDGGNVAIPELADVGAVHSTRGYQPYPVSHWGPRGGTVGPRATGPTTRASATRARSGAGPRSRRSTGPGARSRRPVSPSTSASSGATNRPRTTTPYGGSPTSSACSTSTAGVTPCGISRGRSASSTTAARVPASSTATATRSTSTYSTY